LPYRDLLHARDLRRHAQRLRQHVGFGHRIAEHVVADRRDAVGGVRGAEGDDLRSLRDRIRGLGRVRQRRAEHHQHLVLEDQLLEDIDGLLFLAGFVFDLQRDLVALDAAGGVDFFDGQLEAVLDRLAVLAGRARQRLGRAELDVGGLGRRHQARGDEHAWEKRAAAETG